MGNAYYEEMIQELWRAGQDEKAENLYRKLIKDGLLKSDPKLENWFKALEPISNTQIAAEKWMKTISKYMEGEPDYITNFWDGFKNDADLTDEEMRSRLPSIDDETFYKIKEGKCKNPGITVTIASEFFRDIVDNLSRIKRHSKYVADVFRLLEKLQIYD